MVWVSIDAFDLSMYTSRLYNRFQNEYARGSILERGAHWQQKRIKIAKNSEKKH
jgi:hypothetical protein